MKLDNLIYLISMIVFSCLFVRYDTHRTHDDLHEILELAGKNRYQLIAALSKFDEDSEEFYALRWIINNMRQKESVDSFYAKKQLKIYQALSDYDIISKSIVDSLIGEYLTPNKSHRKTVKDIEIVDSAFLISDIQSCFFARRRWPWAASINLDTYIRYVSPYRVSNEPLKRNWRQSLQSKLLKHLDSIAQITSNPIFAAKLILEIPFVKDFTWTGLLTDETRLGPDLVSCRFGNCQNNADRLTYILRAAGIPCGTDKMIFCGNRNNPHSWLFITDGKGNTSYEDCGKFGSSFELDLPFVKIHRETFENNQEPHTPANLSATEILAVNKFNNHKDVTFEYSHNSVNLIIGLDNVIPKEQYWLCLSEHLNWIPVYPAQKKENTLNFGIVGENCLATVAYIDRLGNLNFATDPFVIRKGKPNYISIKMADMSKIVLYRKFSPDIGEFADNMINGTFEISSDPSFNDDITKIAKIRNAPNRLWSHIQLDYPTIPKRYVRYIGADSTHCDVAELMFFDDSSVSISGKVIGTRNHIDKEHNIEKAFDNNPYTSFHSDNESRAWVGLDLGKPKRISSISYAPRNRDNFVRAGDTYELYIWSKNRWTSLFQTIALADSIAVEIPVEGLLYLKNHTRGHDERPFVMEGNDKQVFY